MGPRQSITTCLRKSFQFSGRASRSEFLWFWVLSALVSDVLFGVRLGPHPAANLGLWFYVATAVPALAVGARRMNDAGHPKWIFIAGTIANFLLSFVAFNFFNGDPTTATAIEWLALAATWTIFFRLFWLSTEESQPGPNKYGPNPLEVTP